MAGRSPQFSHGSTEEAEHKRPVGAAPYFLEEPFGFGAHKYVALGIHALNDFPRGMVPNGQRRNILARYFFHGDDRSSLRRGMGSSMDIVALNLRR